MHQQHQDSLLPPQGKERKAMKQPRNALIWCVFLVCLTLLIFTWQPFFLQIASSC